MNLIIPLGGIGKRFLDEGYSFRKPYLYVKGKHMICWVIDKLNIRTRSLGSVGAQSRLDPALAGSDLKLYDSLYIPYNNILKQYNFEETLKRLYPHINLIMFPIDETKGATHTLRLVLDKIKDKSKRIVSLDGDTFYEDDVLQLIRERKQGNYICYFESKDKEPIYSYIKVDSIENGKEHKIIEIKEKVKISDYANTGCYVFENANVLKKYCDKLLKSLDAPTLPLPAERVLKLENKELYISTIYNEMLKDNLNIYPIKINKFVCLGTPLQIKSFGGDNINTELKRICFDLDNTLVSYLKIPGDYSSVEPIQKNIDYLKYLKSLGNTIIIHTARKMKSSNGNVGKVLADVGMITFETLKKFDIPFDEIYFGKPEADFYIDDKAVNVFSNLEKELGFYNTKSEERSFNNIEIKDNIVTKSSNMDKIMGEIHYYTNIPNEVSDLFPKFYTYEIKENKGQISTKDKNPLTYSYRIEKINGVLLSYLYREKTLTKEILYSFLDNLRRLHEIIVETRSAPGKPGTRPDESGSVGAQSRLDPALAGSDLNKDIIRDKQNMYYNYSEKIIERFQKYKDIYKQLPNSTQIYEDILKGLNKYQKWDVGKFGIIHGDPVFTNIFLVDDIGGFKKFKFIDMRGELAGNNTIYGDIFYDYAKVLQSLRGYEHVLHDISLDKIYRENMINCFNEYFVENYPDFSLETLNVLTDSLLFSLIPLHSTGDSKLNMKQIGYYNLINLT